MMRRVMDAGSVVPIGNHTRGNTLKPYHTWCQCHREIGQTDGAVLIIAGFEVRAPITLWCACGAPTHWRPVKRREDRAPVPVLRYTPVQEPDLEFTPEQLTAVRDHFPIGVAAAAAFLEAAKTGT
jgi:hypothetical protein